MQSAFQKFYRNNSLIIHAVTMFMIAVFGAGQIWGNVPTRVDKLEAASVSVQDRLARIEQKQDDMLTILRHHR